jgi:small conductance mechanosensitive channel
MLGRPARIETVISEPIKGLIPAQLVARRKQTPRSLASKIEKNVTSRHHAGAQSPCVFEERQSAMNTEALQTFISTTLTALVIKIAAAIAFLIIGRWLIGKVIGLIQVAMNRNHIDPTLTKYLGSIVAVALNIAMVLGILGYFGIETTSFAALIAGAGLAIGAAWGGLLGNFAAGAFMLVLRPFKVGDFVTIGGITGTVHELGLFGTTLVTPDSVMTLVGNGKVFSDTVQNFSILPVRRVDRTAQLAQGVDPLDAIVRLKAAIAKIPNVATNPAPEVNLLDFKLEGPVISVRPYTHTANYWQVYFDTNEAIVKVGQEAGWPVPAATQIHRVVQ